MFFLTYGKLFFLFDYKNQLREKFNKNVRNYTKSLLYEQFFRRSLFRLIFFYYKIDGLARRIVNVGVFALVSQTRMKKLRVYCEIYYWRCCRLWFDDFERVKINDIIFGTCSLYTFQISYTNFHISNCRFIFKI